MCPARRAPPATPRTGVAPFAPPPGRPPPTDPPEVPRPLIGDLEIPCGLVEEAGLAGVPGVGPEAITIGTGNDRGGLATFDAGRGLSEAVAALAELWAEPRQHRRVGAERVRNAAQHGPQLRISASEVR